MNTTGEGGTLVGRTRYVNTRPTDTLADESFVQSNGVIATHDVYRVTVARGNPFAYAAVSAWSSKTWPEIIQYTLENLLARTGVSFSVTDTVGVTRDQTTAVFDVRIVSQPGRHTTVGDLVNKIEGITAAFVVTKIENLGPTPGQSRGGGAALDATRADAAVTEEAGEVERRAQSNIFNRILDVGGKIGSAVFVLAILAGIVLVVQSTRRVS